MAGYQNFNYLPYLPNGQVQQIPPPAPLPGLSQGGFNVPSMISSYPGQSSQMSQQGGGSSDNNGMDWGNAVSAGLGGLGNFLENQGKAEQSAAGLQNTAANNVANSANRQQETAQSASQNAMQWMSPDKSVQPFQKMALANALWGSLKPGTTTNNISSMSGVPSSLQGYMPQMQGGLNLDAAKQAVQQYSGPQAQQQAMLSYQQQLGNIDPYSRRMDMNAFFPGQGGDVMNQELANATTAAQGRRAGYENTAKNALQQALTNSQKQGDSGGGFWKGLLSAVGSAAPYVAMAL